MAGSDNGGVGVGFTGLLTVLFIGLKLANVITWSWVWVLSPIWITAIFAIILIIIMLIVAFFIGD